MYLHSSLLVVDKLSPLWAGEDVQVCCGLVRHEGSCTNSNGKDLTVMMMTETVKTKELSGASGA